MERLGRQLFGLLVLAGVLFAILMLLGFAVTLGAIVAPVFGLLYAAFRGAVARRVWQSQGRILLPDNAIRIIGKGRSRLMALNESLNGLGGFAITLAAPALVFDSARQMLVPALVSGALLLIGTQVMRRRLAENAHPVDVLPPE